MTPRMLVTAAAILTMTLGIGAGTDEAISVRESGGAYVVSARFSVPEAAAVVRDVLTDYDNIPRFMPGVRMSRVLERGDGHARIEQEAVSTFMMFSRHVHLVLDITEEPNVIRFRDRCGRSFTNYEGAWTITDRDDRTDIEYQLTAAPAFGVPGFVLRKLLGRDAGVMIGRLRSEMVTRAAAR